MTWWSAAISAGVSLWGASQAGDAAKSARRIGRMNAEALRRETFEEQRRFRLARGVEVGQAKAQAAGSGFSFSMKDETGQARYIKAMEKENLRQLEWMTSASKRQERILEAGGQLAYQQGRAQAVGQIAGAVQSFAQMWTSPDAPWKK